MHQSTRRGSAVFFVVIVIALMVVGGMFYYINRGKLSGPVNTENGAGATQGVREQGEEKTAASGNKIQGSVQQESGGVPKFSGTVLAGTSALLLDFTKADYDAAVKSDKLVVLYFYANWCPICKEETANALYPAFNELTSDTVVGIRVNYKDSDTDKDEENLARQFGIPYQHTKVLVKNGKQILKAPDGWDKARYLAEINKTITQ